MSVSITFSHDDTIGSLWTGVGRPLTAYEADHNFYNLKSAVETLQDDFTLTISIATVTQPTPSSMRVTLTDASFFDLSIPVGAFRDRGSWTVATPYLINDTFTAPDGGLYRVTFDHTSDATSFDPHANDGAGHDYYASMIPAAGNAIAAGGAAGMYYRKSSSTNFDANWSFIPATEVVFSPSTSSTLASDNVAAAIEELEVRIEEGPIGRLDALSDVNVTEGAGINGYFLSWNNSSGKWVAVASSTNLSGMADVNVTEGSGINGYFLQWDNGTGKWIAAASSSSLAGLTDVNVTEGSGINGYFLKWDNGTSKWIASTSALSGLADVNVTEGSGINGYFLKWDNATSKWVASLSGATATALSGLSDVNVTEGSGIDGQVLYWNNGASKWQAKVALASADIGSTVQGYDSDLAALASNATNGLWARTGSGSGSARTITAGTYTSVTNGDGVSGNPAIDVVTATAAQYQANTANKVLTTDKVWSAADLVALTDAATIAVDMSTFINASVTLGGNRTLGNPSNTKNGQTGVIKVVQDGTGSRTLAYASNWKFAGGTAPILTTTASAVDLLFYQVISSTFIYVTAVKDVK